MDVVDFGCEPKDIQDRKCDHRALSLGLGERRGKLGILQGLGMKLLLVLQCSKVDLAFVHRSEPVKLLMGICSFIW